jgi:hypothetical protein
LGGWHRWEEGGGGERGRRRNTVQIMYMQVWNAKVYLLKLFRNWRRVEEREQWMGEGGRGDSSMIYLTHCKNLCKCYNVPKLSTKTIIIIKRPK